DEMAWHLIVDLTKLWSPEGAAIYNAVYDPDVVVGDPVFPKCWDGEIDTGLYTMCIEIGDAEGNQCGDNSSCVCCGTGNGCYEMELYGMHLLSPNEFDPICTTEGSSVQITWNFHADCEPEEDFLIEIYDPDKVGPEAYAAWPGYFTVTNISICDCVTHTVNVPLLAVVPDGKYNVKITSTCQGLDCTKWVEEEDAVIVDTIDPTVTLISPTTATNLNDDPNDDLDVFWTHGDNTGVTSVLIEYSTTGCAGPWSTLDDLDESEITAAWNGTTLQYEKTYDVG
ncbi:unnamed protein product, partial [marine sediment metagenome]